MLLILPAAGRGVRMHSVTNGQPKELLPLGDSTVLGVTANEVPGVRVCLVGSAAKPELEPWVHLLGGLYDLQEKPNGLGPALMPFLRLGEASLVALPDTVYWPASPLPRIARLLEEGLDIAIAAETVDEIHVSRYGICDVEGEVLRGVVEKPEVHVAPSRWAIAARYGFSGRASAWMADWLALNLPESGEISITPAIDAALKSGFTGRIVPLQGERRLDCGAPEGYLEAKELFG